MVKILSATLDKSTLKKIRKMSLGERFLIADEVYRDMVRRRKRK